MTVLIAAGTTDAVAIAADGLRVSAVGGYRTESAQKVWLAQSKDEHPVIFGWSGQTVIQTANEAISLPDTSLRIFRNVHLGSYDDCPADLVRDFATTIKARLDHLLRAYDPTTSALKLSDELAAAVIAWYSRSHPVAAVIGFKWEGGTVVPYQILQSVGEDFLSVVSGSKTLIERGFPEITSLESVVEVVKNFAEANNREVIPDCSGFGGSVHVAILRRTVQNGFLRPSNSDRRTFSIP